MSKSTLQAERPLKGLEEGETARGKMNCFEIASEHDIAVARTLQESRGSWLYSQRTSESLWDTSLVF